MIDVKDEILGEDAKYNIAKADTGEIIYSNVAIDLANTPMQKGTPINKALFDSIKGDVYRIDKYTEPETKEAQTRSENIITGSYIGLWGNSHYTKYGITVSASSENGENYAYKAMNGVDGYWASGSVPAVATPALFTVDLGKEIVLRKFTISGSGGLYCKNFKLQGSNDGDIYYDIMNVSNNTSSENEYTTTSTAYYRYYRLNITASGSSTDLAAILEFNITAWSEAEKINSIELTGIPLTSYIDKQRLLLNLSDNCDKLFKSNILPPMMKTSENGYLIQSSGDFINTSVIDAFDYDDEYTYWKSLETQTERYIMVTMPISVIPARFNVKFSNVKNGKIQGSNDGDNWDDLLTGIAATELVTLENDVETTKKYRYFRFIFNANTEGTSSLIYSFGITRGYISGFNYDLRTFININSLGYREVSGDSIGEEGNYEFVYDSNSMTYTAYLNSFSRSNVENTFTAAEKEKLAGIEVGAEVNIIDGIKVNGVEALPDGNRVVSISAIPNEQKGAKGGVATLGGDGKVPSSQLPNIEVNIVTSIDSSSTDDEVPSAKCVYDIVGNVEALLSKI